MNANRIITTLQAINTRLKQKQYCSDAQLKVLRKARAKWKKRLDAMISRPLPKSKQLNLSMKTLVTIFLFILLMAALSSCASNPYWRVYRHDGVENRGYMKRGWTNDVSCTAYDSNRPVQRSTWSKQYYWKPKYK